MNRVDPIYHELINYILRFGIDKQSRTGKVKSVFGFQFRHYMPLGFPLITTRKVNFKTIATEFLWSLRGETNIKFLIENGCNTWTDNVYEHYVNTLEQRKEEAKENIRNGCSSCEQILNSINILSKEDFCKEIIHNPTFAHSWGDLGPVTGHQWRNSSLIGVEELSKLYDRQIAHDIQLNRHAVGTSNRKYAIEEVKNIYPAQDQLVNLLCNLKNDPDSRRLVVNSWNIYDIPQMIIPPAQHTFQVYTRPLIPIERLQAILGDDALIDTDPKKLEKEWLDERNAPERSISLMWNQRSVDTALCLPHNIAHYALLLVTIGHIMNMVPEHLIGNLGDCHIHENQIDPILFQLERKEYFLPKLKVDNSVWRISSDDYSAIIKSIAVNDFILQDYQCHPAIKIPTNI